MQREQPTNPMEKTMKISTFNAECLKRTIEPSLALENELVVLYLTKGMDAEVLAVLDSDF